MSFSVQFSEEISHRCDFSILANARGYRDAVEVGTDLGVFAREFLSRFEGNWLFCIDPYLPYPERPTDRSGDMLVAALALAPYHGRHRIVRASSIEAAAWVPSMITPEFVYVDASHEEADVASDLRVWWGVLPSHGMLAGHDYDPGHPGVVAAVDHFARKRGLTVRLTHETTAPPSFYLYKTEPEVLYHRLFREGESPNSRFDGGA